MRYRTVIFFVLALEIFARDHIGDIEFFGYKGFNVAVIRNALPVHAGDVFSTTTKEQIRQAIQRITGAAPTDVAPICCDTQGDPVIFVGLPGGSTKSFSYNPEPTGTERLSSTIMDLYEKLETALEAAVHKGGTGIQEDDSKGYALANDPAAHALQLAIRRYALQHEDELMRVLKNSADASQRAAAADVLGYARQSPQQIAALVHASRDPDEGVRNNATPALGVLAASNSQLAKEIPAETFIEMISSGIWKDRNKAAFLLLELTRNRDPKLLNELRTQALDSLIEMAKWHDTGHAVSARILLGRIAGIPEDELNRLALQGPVETILNKVEAH